MRARRNAWVRVALVTALAAAGCTPTYSSVRLTDDWPSKTGDYDDVVRAWTRKAQLRGEYQEVCDLAAVLKSPDWRAAYAERDADHRGLTGQARSERMTQSRADAAGPYELEVLLTTWDRRENDLDRGKKSVWRVVLIDDKGEEIEPLEIIKDRRPTYVVRADYPDLGEFATPYVVRFPRSAHVFGPASKQVRLRLSSSRGGLEVDWNGE